jgi:hypothetical protein
MTFILFMLSLAAVGTILKKSDTSRGDAQDKWAERFYSRHQSPVVAPGDAPEATAGLAALGLALEQHGRGEIPGAAKPAITAADEVVGRS